ncbi:MAG: serine/threonine-protein kinase, partial [Gemmatimonadaceae bacterium]
ANERYQSAAQFGRELWAACERMPASQAAEAGTQVISAPPVGGTVPSTRVAGPSDKGKTVAAPAAKAAATAEPAPVAVKKSNMGMIAAAVIGVAVLGGGGYFIVKGGGSSAPAQADSSVTTPAQGAGAPAATATPAGGVTQLKTPVNPAGGGGRTQGTAPGPSGAAPVGGAALVAKWMPQQDDLTKGSAQQLVNELEPAIPSLSGETKGKAYYLVGRAYHKLDNIGDACSMLEKAKPLVTGSILSVVNVNIDGICK